MLHNSLRPPETPIHRVSFRQKSYPQPFLSTLGINHLNRGIFAIRAISDKWTGANNCMSFAFLVCRWRSFILYCGLAVGGRQLLLFSCCHWVLYHPTTVAPHVGRDPKPSSWSGSFRMPRGLFDWSRHHAGRSDIIIGLSDERTMAGELGPS